MSIDGPVSSITLTGAPTPSIADSGSTRNVSAAWQRRGGLQLAGNPDPQRGQALLRGDR